MKKPEVTISNNTFTGVSFDAKATDAIIIVAQALLNLTKVFNTQGIHIDTMLSVNHPDEPKE